MKKIGIIGAGNVGSVLAVKFSISNQVYLYTSESKVNLINKNMRVFFEDNNSYYSGNIYKITSDLKELVDNSDYIFVTFPAFLFPDLANSLLPLLKAGQHLIFVPGSGGAELFFKDAIKKGVTISGLQRIHCVARIIKIGEEVKESGVRKAIRVASIPNSYNKEACLVLKELYNLDVEPLDNYLNITFVNSNPILHTSRLFSIFHDYPNAIKEYDSLPLFYEEWDLDSSKLLVKMDKELFSIFSELKKYGLNVNQITPILEHYESKDEIGLTKKLNSINSLKGLKTPSILNENGKLLPDLESRYFVADFPFGLAILIAFASFLNVDHPNMDLAYKWYESLNNSKKERFDLSSVGIHKIDDLIELYK